MYMLRRFGAFIMIVASFFVLYACKNELEDIILTAIEVETSTLDSSYDVDNFNLSMIHIRVIYSDDHFEIKPLTSEMLSREHLTLLSHVGQHHITIMYKGKTTTLSIHLQYNALKNQLMTIYSLAISSHSFTGTYEEWLHTVGGPLNHLNHEVLLQVSNGYIQWSYPEESTWTNLVLLSSLVNQDGSNAKSAYDLYIDIYPDYIGNDEQWLDDLIHDRLGNYDVYTVTFDSHGGSLIESQKIEKGQKVIEPILPTKIGYSFDGWYINGDEKWVFEVNNVTEDIKLTASWIPHTYKLTLHVNGGELDESHSHDVIYNQAFSLPVPKSSGIPFYGWYYNDTRLTDEYGVGLEEWTFAIDLTLEAVYYISISDAFVFIDEAFELLEVAFQDGDNAASVTKQLILPTTLGRVTITWTSSHSQTISTEGDVTRSENEDITVTLTARLTLGDAYRDKIFEVIVIGLVEPFDVDAFKATINLPTETKVDLDLVETYLDYVITWTSNHTNVIKHDGTITRQEEDVTVELTATITVDGIPFSVKFYVIVVKTDIVVPDYHAILNSIIIPETTIVNLNLATLVSGVEIVWESSHAAISHTGLVIRQDRDIIVTLTAFVKDQTYFYKTFTVTVLQITQFPLTTKTPIVDVREMAQGASVTVQGVITSLMTNGNYTIQDNTGAIPVYMNNNTSLKVGTEYIIKGTLGAFNGLIQISSPQIVETKGTYTLYEGFDLTGYSLDYDDVLLYEAHVITYKNLEVTEKKTPNNAIELYLKNLAGETTFVRLDTRVNTTNPFTAIHVGEMVDLFNVTVGQYQGKAQLLFTSRSTIVGRPKNPEIISIYGAVNKNFIIGDPLPNLLEGITARNGFNQDFTAQLQFDAPNLDFTEAGDYEIIVYLPGHSEVYVTYTLFVRKEIEVGVYEGYYASLDGLTGTHLIQAIRSLIVNTGKSTGTTSQVQLVDKVGSSYYLIYDGMGAYGNREHVWPDSKLGSVKYDLHNLRAANSSTNSSRGNLPFVEDGKTFTGSQPYGKYSGGWYPGDEHIGDVARIVLYVMIRFNLNLDLVGNLHVFLQWHQMDPVNDFERARNDKIYGIQDNRNPFIDHPELVEFYFGSSTPQNLRMSMDVARSLLSATVYVLVKTNPLNILIDSKKSRLIFK